MSEDGDWYMIGEENEKEYYVADLAMVGGVNAQRNGEIKSEAKIATFEIAEKMYEKMLEMAKKGKNTRYDATRDTSYVNTKRNEEKGIIEIVEEKEGNFGDSDIEMREVEVKVNIEKMEEELEKVREILKRLREKEMTKTKEKKKEDKEIR